METIVYFCIAVSQPNRILASELRMNECMNLTSIALGKHQPTHQLTQWTSQLYFFFHNICSTRNWRERKKNINSKNEAIRRKFIKYQVRPKKLFCAPLLYRTVLILVSPIYGLEHCASLSNFAFTNITRFSHVRSV